MNCSSPNARSFVKIGCLADAGAAHDKPTWDDYEALHKKMEAQGFRRTITGGVWAGEYFPFWELTCMAQQVTLANS